MTPLFGPGWGNYAIRGIHEIRLPEATSLQLQTPGWWVLLGLLLAWALRRGWQAWQKYQRNAYRRDAQVTLLALRDRVESGDQEALRELAPLLRATALAATQRTVPVTSWGDDWSSALSALATPDCTPLPLQQLHALAYEPLERCDTSDTAALFTLLEAWIGQHEYVDA